MSTESNKTIFFLCCFCGIKIHANRNNLDQHEKLHSSLVSKIKCAAKYCGSHFANKSIYWKHWMVKHSTLTMPDFLIYVDVPAELSRRGRPLGRGEQAKEVKKVHKNRAARATKMLKPANATKSNGCENDGVCHIEKTEYPNYFNLNLENTIEDCLLRDPFYGSLSRFSDL